MTPMLQTDKAEIEAAIAEAIATDAVIARINRERIAYDIAEKARIVEVKKDLVVKLAKMQELDRERRILGGKIRNQRVSIRWAKHRARYSRRALGRLKHMEDMRISRIKADIHRKLQKQLATQLARLHHSDLLAKPTAANS